MRVLLVGFGNVGRQLAGVVTRERERFPNLAGLQLQFTAITTRSRGTLVNPEGIDLEAALVQIEERGRFSEESPEFSSLDSAQACHQLPYDVLIELSTLSIEQRGEPAVSYIRTALERGRHVVTANKGPVAFCYGELSNLAREKRVSLLHESTVMDGAPVFNLARTSLLGCRIQRVRGILNSTTNFILSCLETGRPMEAALKEAQRAGFAEADARHDLEGWDAAAKTAVLANALMGGNLTPLEVRREGIQGVTMEQAQQAVERGRRLKLMCEASRQSQGIEARVELQEVPLGSVFAACDGPGSALGISTDLMGDILIVQRNPTLYDTVYGVLNDLLSLA